MPPACPRCVPVVLAVAMPTNRLPRLQRICNVIEWALPIATLALIPKCPACVASYVLLFGGIGLSLPAAAAVRWTLISLNITALFYLIFRTARRRSRHCTTSSRLQSVDRDSPGCCVCDDPPAIGRTDPRVPLGRPRL